MTVTEAIAAIRASTLHDADTQVTDAQITVKIDQEYKRLRRQLVLLIPSLYEVVSTPTITAGNTTIAKPTDFERLVLLERQSAGSQYFALTAADRLNKNDPDQISFYERASNFVVQPDSLAPGSYRLTVVLGPTTGYTSLDVPGGCEDVIVERAAAWVCARHEDDPSYHDAAADRIWREQRSVLIRRYGAHPQPGLARTRRWR
jgi:hypothetical protein